MSERPHGYARYRLDGCRCYVCGLARSMYDENRQKQVTAGTWQPFVDAQPVREHLAVLAAAGIGTRQVSELSGVARSALLAVKNGRRGNPPGLKVRRETADAILAVLPTPAGFAAHASVDGTGTARRIQALAAIGWSLSEQARRVGWSVQNFQVLVCPSPVLAETARLVAGMYDELSMVPAPDSRSATRSRNMAAAKGWVPPLSWDDDTIDDPEVGPAVASDESRALLLAEFAARYRLAVGRGLKGRKLAESLGLTADAVKGRRARARRAGLLEVAA